MSDQTSEPDAKAHMVELWARLAQETPEAGAAQVRAWLAIDGMCRQHADVLEAMATRLADTWTPTKGSAAEAFQAFVGRLVGSMRLTAQAAYRNGLSVDAFHQGLMETRTGVARLMAEFERREAVEKARASGGIAGSTRTMASAGWRRQLADEAAALVAASDATADIAMRVAQFPQHYSVDSRDDAEPEPSGGKTTGEGGRAGAGDSNMGPEVFPRGVPVLAGGVDSPSSGPVGSGGSQAPGGTQPVSGAGFPGRQSMPGGLPIGVPEGRVIGAHPIAPGPRSGDPAPTGRASGVRPGVATGGAAAHGAVAAGMVGAPMMPMTGGVPTTARDGTRIGRPGGVIGGQRGKRPYDPDDPWAVEADGVTPIIGAECVDAVEESAGALPPGVVKVEGWPR
ncbi:hypothetical protein [Luedemannella helvata]|uniref:PPE family domain-containing protein n=1 Tax=Luedemannella helvata TaxID=349315 RepID=A0ABN2KE26_9ACTN